MSRKKPKGVKHAKHAASTPLLLEPTQQLLAIIERTRSATLSAEEYEKLKAAINTLTLLRAELAKQQTSLARLRQMLFGASSEHTRSVLEAK